MKSHEYFISHGQTLLNNKRKFPVSIVNLSRLRSRRFLIYLFGARQTSNRVTGMAGVMRSSMRARLYLMQLSLLIKGFY